MSNIVLIGEGMLELSGGGSAGGWQLGYGGDTLNMAVHLARFGDNARFFSALGDDAFSGDLRRAWEAEGVDGTLLLTAPRSTVGLYAIQTDPAGERSFSYWRGESAARRMFDLAGTADAIAAAERADVLLFSLISVAILPDSGREALLALADRMRLAGKQVVFDGNYRSMLWPDADAARSWRDRAIACCTIGLPTLEDERQMSETGDAAAVAARWQALGPAEVIVKLGAEGCRIPDGRTIPPPARLTPRDTSGAGDAFNAGYIHSRCAGASIADAAMMGHRLAGWVVLRPGAVPARDAGSPYGGDELEEV